MLRTQSLVCAVILIVVFAPAIASAGKVGDDASRPNILLLMAEDMSSRVGAFGDPVAVTPNLDALAERGVRYVNTFTTAGVCAPSRAAQITGMHQAAIGAQHMRSSAYTESPYRAVPPPHVKAYPELLRLGGYFTFTSRKLDYQFSEYAPGSGPFTIWDFEGAEQGWNARADGQPFFGLLNFPQTHESQLFDRNVASNTNAGLVRITDPASVTIPAYYPDTPVVREYIARQYDNVHAMDAAVGQLLANLEKNGLAESTIVIWTTDHGDGLPRAKREIYDSGIHVPMIIHWPKRFRPADVQPGTVDRRLVSFVDLGPTILKLAGVPVPGYMHGSPVLLAGEPSRAYVYAEKDRMDEVPFYERAIRDKRFKYVRNYMPGTPGATRLRYREQLGIMAELWQAFESGAMNEAERRWFEPRPEEELYDTVNDPDEVVNLAASPEHADTLARMRTALADRMREIGDLSRQSEGTMARQFWPEGQAPVTPPPVIRQLSPRSASLKASLSGASLGYRIDDGPWRVVVEGQAITVPRGSQLTAKSVRYGWQESAETHQEF